MALVATILGLDVADMIRDAITSRSVLVKSIEIAPDLSDQVPSAAAELPLEQPKSVGSAGFLHLGEALQQGSRLGGG